MILMASGADEGPASVGVLFSTVDEGPASVGGLFSTVDEGPAPVGGLFSSFFNSLSASIFFFFFGERTLRGRGL